MSLTLYAQLPFHCSNLPSVAQSTVCMSEKYHDARWRLLTTSACCSTACDSLHTLKKGPLVSFLEGGKRKWYRKAKRREIDWERKRERERDRGRERERKRYCFPHRIAAHLTQTSEQLMLLTQTVPLWIEASFVSSPPKRKQKTKCPIVLRG